MQFWNLSNSYVYILLWSRYYSSRWKFIVVAYAWPRHCLHHMPSRCFNWKKDPGYSKALSIATQQRQLNPAAQTSPRRRTIITQDIRFLDVVCRHVVYIRPLICKFIETPPRLSDTCLAEFGAEFPLGSRRRRPAEPEDGYSQDSCALSDSPIGPPPPGAATPPAGSRPGSGGSPTHSRRRA